MKNGRKMKCRVTELASSTKRMDGTPCSVTVSASSYGDEISFTTDAASAPSFGERLYVTVEWGEGE